MRILKGFESKEEAIERTYREQEKIRLVKLYLFQYINMSDLDKTHNIFHQVTKKYVYITIDNVPTGVKFYTKPGSG